VGEAALRHFLGHPLLGFLGEVVDVVLGHQHLDAVDELLMGPAVAADDLAFLDQMDFEVEVVDGHVVPEVAVEPVRLLDEDHPEPGCLGQVVEHVAELGASSLFGRLHVHKLPIHHQPVLGRVLPEQPELSWDGESLPLLLGARDPGVDDGLPRGCRARSGRQLDARL
jgi:hypothetical protein